ncbi:histidine kinase [Gracilibacillus marinus]|uniref:Histidine kinase n=1 Tax=Gracilibacillus marinus TaxID=630535 RepID=A0ABV8VTT4_9BACI
MYGWNWVNRSLRTKMLVMFVLLTIMPLIVISIIFYMKSSTMMEERAYHLAKVNTAQVTSEIDFFFQDIYRYAEIGNLESTHNFLLKKEEILTTLEIENILEFIQFYRRSLTSSDAVFDVQIISSTGETLSEQRGVVDRYTFARTLRLLDWEKDTTSKKMNVTQRNGFPAIEVITPIYTRDIKSLLGWTVIVLDAQAITSILNQASQGIEKYSIHSNEQNIYLHHDSQATETDNVLLRQKNLNEDEGTFTIDEVFYVYHTSKLTNWKVIGRTDIYEQKKDSIQLGTLFFLTIISSIIFTIGLYFYISNRLIDPVKTLKRQMKKASKGDLKATVTTLGDDEIADLGRSYNTMLERIRGLIKNNLEKQNELNQAEFRVMQAQINPHFLYNTLDTIVWMAIAKDHESVTKLTKSLSQYCRISLSKGNDWITVGEEVDHITNYLQIQKIRYEEILDYSIDIDTKIYRREILKLLLQPIVENAIYHGIKNKRGKGYIIIKGKEIANEMVFEIIDNGIGMTKERLAYLRDKIEKREVIEKAKSGFGLYNVAQRLTLYYGENATLSINSWENAGTRVVIKIPRSEKE